MKARAETTTGIGAVTTATIATTVIIAITAIIAVAAVRKMIPTMKSRMKVF